MKRVLALSFICIFLLSSIALSSMEAAPIKHDQMPVMVNMDWSNVADLDSKVRAALHLKKGQVVSDETFRSLVNFEFMYKSGIQAVFFQSSYGKDPTEINLHRDSDKGIDPDAGKNHDPDDGTDESVRLWMKQAADTGMLIGCYHFYHCVPKQSPEEQARLFLIHVSAICADDPDTFRNRKILLAFDGRHEEDPETQLNDLTRFAREVHRLTTIWPGFYPENGGPEIHGVSNDLYYPVFEELGPNSDLAKCWLWGSGYEEGYNASLFNHVDGDGYTGLNWYRLWTSVTFWQYGQSDDLKRQDKEKNPMSVFYNRTSGFPIAAPGSLIPLDSNYYLNDKIPLSQFWNDHGWIAYPAPSWEGDAWKPKSEPKDHNPNP